jgi:hypothetical protein
LVGDEMFVHYERKTWIFVKAQLYKYWKKPAGFGQWLKPN